MTKTFLFLVGLITLSLLLVNVSSQNNCTSASNTYWTGYRCACKVGFKNQSNTCIPLNLQIAIGWVQREPAIVGNSTTYTTTNSTPIPTANTNTNCYLPYEFYNGQGCVCLTGYARVNGLCQSTGATTVSNITCPANSVLTSGVCVCSSGYTKVNSLCVANSSGCGANSQNNGLGFCVCNTGYYKVNSTCIQGTPCPPSSSRAADGTCVCDSGFTKYGSYCAKCPLGSIFDNSTQKCVYVCGQNSAYNTTAQQCLCLPGYGIHNSVCSTCPANFIVFNNYCVTCPVNSVYSSTTNTCQCAPGYLLGTSGFCVQKCGNTQVFNSTTGNCDCLAGLGTVNGTCQLCPSGTTPNSNGVCAACGTNQALVNGACICTSGFIPNELNICTQCSQVTGAFLVNGVCAKCPGTLVYNGQACGCPSGSNKIGTQCIAACNNDELVDTNGLCYSCPIYEVSSNGVCVCQTNYIRNSTTGRCQLSCPSGQFIYQGRCAQCPLNLQYRSEIGGCACPNGLYLNTYGVCETVVIAPITCTSGSYFDSVQGCVSCPSGCSACSSATVCTSCTQNGYSAVNGVCKTVCGDGIIAGNQLCDAKNLNGPSYGCSSSCLVAPNWVCTGQPSVCKSNTPTTPNNTTPTNPTNTTQGLTLIGNVSTNINNVYVVLNTTQTFTFANQNDMESFLKASFPDSSAVPSVYCSQRSAPQLQTFDCLAIYSSGIPNQQFHINFSFNYQGQTGSISVLVNPLASSLASRGTTAGRGTTAN